MKKFIAVLLVTMTLTLGLAACGGSDSEFVGKWSATGIMMGETETSFDDAGVELEMTFDIKSNGDLAVDTGTQSGEGSWTEKDGTITMTDDTESEITGSIKDGKLILSVSGIDVVCEKQ